MLEYQILWNSVKWEPSCSMQMDGWIDGRTDRQTEGHDEANSHFYKF
jgi:hypothetical protein